MKVVRCLAFLILMPAACSTPPRQETRAVQLEKWSSSPMPDLSGMAWVAGDTFLVVHDAKATYEPGLPRVGLVVLPDTNTALRWRPLSVRWPSQTGISHDLESIARLPGTRSFLLVESGDDATPYQRIFLAEYAGGRLTVRESATWPEPVHNVEGAAVARLGDALLFLYAERAPGMPSTPVVYRRLTLNPLRFGPAEQVTFHAVDPVGPSARPVSALEVDKQGRLYVASALDPEVDTGPFRSAVWEIGTFSQTATGGRLDLAGTPRHLATLDGLKVESLAARPGSDGRPEFFVGTDDERYGSVMRRLP